MGSGETTRPPRRCRPSGRRSPSAAPGTEPEPEPERVQGLRCRAGFTSTQTPSPPLRARNAGSVLRCEVRLLGALRAAAEL